MLSHPDSKRNIINLKLNRARYLKNIYWRYSKFMESTGTRTTNVKVSSPASIPLRHETCYLSWININIYLKNIFYKISQNYIFVYIFKIFPRLHFHASFPKLPKNNDSRVSYAIYLAFICRKPHTKIFSPSPDILV